jgi:hypothetical protein
LSSIRKMLWPSAIALGFLVFLGAVGQGNVIKTASADQGDICAILSTANAVDGEFILSEDETILVVAIVENESFDDDLDEEDDGDGLVFDAEVNLDDSTGDSNLTSRAEEDEDEWEYVDGYETDHFNEVGIIQSGDDTDALEDDLNDEFGGEDEDFVAMLEDDEGVANEFEIGDNVCGDDDDDIFDDLLQFILDAVADCIDEEDCEDFWTDQPGFNGPESTLSDVGLSPEDVAIFIAEWIFDEGPGFECGFGGLYTAVEDFLILEGVSPDIADDIATDVQEDEDMCEDDDWPGFSFGEDGWIIVDVTCEEPGEFEVSFSIFGENEDSASANFVCVGEVDEGLITATPSKVEIVPALGSTSFSLIIVELLDENGDPAAEGVTVDFDTDRCVFLDEDGLSEEDFLELVNLFEEFNVNDEETAQAIEDFLEDVDLDDDSDDVSNEVESFTLDDDTDDFDEGDTLAAAILDCSDSKTVPGIANVCFQVDQEGGDVDGCVKVTVVGPPAKITAAAAPASLICGEKATISVEVLDAANQPVSDHTRVEAVTNLGGVLAGTGAVAGQAGLVTPVSSTVAETFNGKATLYLLTSDAHTGPYEVVVASGGSGSVNTGLGGVFSTPPQVTQVTVTCTQPAVAAAPSAPAPTVTAPRTGTGTIAPPNTGDAGLADQSAGSSFALILVAGVVAFSVAGLATLKISRR